eukprot:scaffold3414_cov183-Ochromonas_danica.AAC.1
METNTEALIEEIESHPDVNLLFFPERAYIYTKTYYYEYPLSSNYRIGLLLDPCRTNAYNCCMNVFGQPEYPALLKSGLESERVYQYLVLGDDAEVSKNYKLVYEDGSSVTTTVQRTPDDFKLFNETCISENDPASYCEGRDYAYQRSSYRPPCIDYNTSINATSGCYDPLTGDYQTHCVQVAYSSTTFIPQCSSSSDDEVEDCGTYLEVHIAHGTPYNNQTDIISEVQVTTRNVSVFRIGSLAYVTSAAPVCCCPPAYSSTTRVGSFQCPIGPTDDGAYAYHPKSIADTLSLDTLLLDYPFCPIDLSASIDRMMCSVIDSTSRRAYTRNCTIVANISSIGRTWTSIDMEGEYDSICPYYDSCALTLDAGKCYFNDLKFTFIGQVGIVTDVDNTATIPK